MERQYLVQAKYYRRGMHLEVVNFTVIDYGLSGEEQSWCEEDLANNFKYYLSRLDSTLEDKDDILYKVVFEVITDIEEDDSGFTDIIPLLYGEVTEVELLPEDTRILH